MASRRLAISSLLCADDSDAAAAGPSSYSPPESLEAREASINDSHVSPSKSSPISSWSTPAAEAVPMAGEHDPHAERRSSSPSSRSALPFTTHTVVPRRSFRDIVFDTAMEQAASVTHHSANSPAVDIVDYPSQRQSLRPHYVVDRSPPERRKDYSVHVDSDRSAECSYSTALSS